MFLEHQIYTLEWFRDTKDLSKNSALQEKNIFKTYLTENYF